MTYYRHTQISPLLLGAVGLLLGVMAWASQRLPPPPAPIVVGAAFTVCTLLIFSTLTVTVRDGKITLFFGPSIVRRTIRLSKVRNVRVVRNHWYWGWGIRITPHGWLWNVYGLDAVEIEYTNGGRFRIGTDEPQALAEAIRRGMLET